MIDIIYLTKDLVAAHRAAVETVAAERIYLGLVTLPPFDPERAFARRLIENDWPIYAAMDGETLVGYVLYSAQTGTYTILDLAVDPTHPHRVDAALTLITALHNAHANMRRYVYTNIPATDPLLPALTQLGYTTWYQQHELIWKLDT